MLGYLTGVGIDVPIVGYFEHQLQIIVGVYILNSWVMFKWDIYQPLLVSNVAVFYLDSDTITQAAATKLAAFRGFAALWENLHF